MEEQGASSSSRVVCYTGALGGDVAPSNLRCRFGNQDVSAQKEGDTISCCPPKDYLSQAQGQGVNLQILGDDDKCIVSQENFDLSTLGLVKGCVDSQAADAQPAGPPCGDDTACCGQVSLTLEQADKSEKAETRGEYLRREYSALRPFVIISVSYLLYTITDGAIRMIVLLHAYNMGFTAMEVAIMFSMYELAGVFTNLLAGMAGARWGIKNTLITGLFLQLVGISVLFAWQESWGQEGQKWKAIVFVTCAQMLCGIAKDLTKLGGKTVTKLITSDEKQSRLFKLVSFITGWKNSLKGAGYFIGAACLSFNYYFALGILLLLIVLAMPWAMLGLTNKLGRTRKENLTLQKIFKQSFNVNVLSFSRFFLFGSRDMWFDVPLPFFLRNSIEGLGWSRAITGLFLAVWIIVYGQIQSWTPQLVLQPLRQSPANKYACVLWCAVLVGCPLFMGIMMQASDIFYGHDVGGMTAVLISGLSAFCLVFAVNSSIHSYLIVKYADGDKVAMNIGFYYMANAMGRLTGTLVSGALYSYCDSVVTGFAACFWCSFGFSLLSASIDMVLKDNSGGLFCGPCLPIVRPPLSSSAAAEASGKSEAGKAEE